MLNLAQNLLGGNSKEADIAKRKSRFEILDDKQLENRSSRPLSGKGASGAIKSKSFFGNIDFGDDEDEEEEEQEKYDVGGTVGKHRGGGNIKKNKVAPTM